MATTLLEPVSETAEERKKEALRHYQIICKAGGLVSVNSLRIGFHAYALKRDNLFGVIGFESESDAQKASGVGESTWYAMIRLAEQFNGVDEDLFCAMRQANAKALADIPESKRLTEYWVRMAATDSIKDFADKVDKELDGKARESDGKERSVPLKVDMPKSRKKFVEAGILEFAESVGAKGDISKGLELMVTEHIGGVSLIESITKAVTIIAEIKKLEKKSSLSAAEILEKVDAQLDEMVVLFKGALQCARSTEG